MNEWFTTQETSHKTMPEALCETHPYGHKAAIHVYNFRSTVLAVQFKDFKFNNLIIYSIYNQQQRLLFFFQQRLGATQAEIQERIHDRLKQMEELKQAVDALKVCTTFIHHTDMAGLTTPN